ncbi:hypothetical protein H257_03226 [Aphanomyces astaci]|uniref:Uncharacterized protein n=1 Tax=Aphanomyces astaci TaxID=112090 RepID=W4H2N4_APHAT|nr:hypothetical protein H257_03226 [Aphanomyces astaci]ETV85504.1 hypothetical protein H257_03226 [Aphanomyces astaci]|eukprot:XP_009825522.1 hypothetical protein H257_03226 [Aphanomyces astaci]
MRIEFPEAMLEIMMDAMVQFARAGYDVKPRRQQWLSAEPLFDSPCLSVGNEHALDLELPGSDHRDAVEARYRSEHMTSPAARTPRVDRFDDRGRPRTSATARRLFRSQHGRRQTVAVDEAWSYGRPATFAAPGFGSTSGTALDMGQNDVHLRNAPALSKSPTFTKEERRVCMSAYNMYISQANALTANGVRPFITPVRACIEPVTKQRIAEWNM